ncbi:MAG TPA: helix-turn-helix domain-containing protein [Verrucomicrobiae bacterium]|nr:helix-turn-helix domain-containing protein [Verrucomicrobiae bacterium]
MSTVAEQLHQAREAKKLTVEQVAEITKIRGDHLRALEEGNFNVFSAPVYIRGFVRTYSTLLKLDVPRVMAALDGELGQTQKFAEPPPLSSEPRGAVDFLMLQLSKIDWHKGVLILGAVVVVLAVVLGYAAYHHYRTNDPLKNVKPGLYKAPAHGSGDTLPVPPVKR